MNVKFLKENPIFFSMLGFSYDPPITTPEGKPYLLKENHDQFVRYHTMFQDIGVKVHTCIIHSGWTGVDKYDYSLTDETLHKVFEAGEDVYFLPRIKLNVPNDWCEKYPEDVFCYYEAYGKSREELLELIGSPKQEFLTYGVPKWWDNPEEFRKTVHDHQAHVISRQSISSVQWLNDAGEALRRFIEHVEQSPYADHIVGYHISFGPCGESMQWGRAFKHYGDYGIENLRLFYDYGLNKYGDIDILKEKWLQPELTRDTVELPSPDKRYADFHDLQSYYRGRVCDVICRDFDEFLSKVVVDAIEYFCKIVKEQTNKLAGSFYGYFMYCYNATYAGHLEMDRLLDSPYLDFLAAPIAYYKRVGSQPSYDMCTTQSVNRKKIWMEELDCRTHLVAEAVGIPDDNCAKTLQESNYVFWRELCKNFAHGSGFWWMDLGGGWFDSPEIMQEVDKVMECFEQFKTCEHHSISDVLIVVDDQSIYHTQIHRESHYQFLTDFICNIRSAGCMSDVYRISDLPELDLSQYKLIIFAWNFHMTSEMWNRIHIPKTATVMFHHATGIWDEHGCSVENIEKLTGFQLEEYWNDNLQFPMLKILDEESEDFAIHETEQGRRIMNTREDMTTDMIREILKISGCHIYTEEDCIIYGTDRYVGVFSCGETNTTIKLPLDGTYKDIISGQTYDTKVIPLHLGKNEYMILLKDDNNGR